jgi:quercetin dioxygenase-like cupin family protein
MRSENTYLPNDVVRLMKGDVWNSKEVRYADSLKYEDFFARWEDGTFASASTPVSVSEGPTWRCANLLTRDTGSHMYVAEVDLEPGGGHDYHAHVCVEFAYIIAGEAQFVYRSTKEKDICEVLKAGGVAYFPAGTPHSAWNTSDKPCKLLIIKQQPPYSFEELPTPSHLKGIRLFNFLDGKPRSRRGLRNTPVARAAGRKSLKSLPDRADR